MLLSNETPTCNIHTPRHTHTNTHTCIDTGTSGVSADVSGSELTKATSLQVQTALTGL